MSCPENIINADIADRIRNASLGCDEEKVLSQIDAVHSAQQKIAANANARLTMDIMAMRLARV